MIMRWTRTLIATFLLSSLSVAGSAQHTQTPQSESPVHYRVYDAQGNQSSFEAVVDRALESDVVLVGEEHDDPIAHWLQAELLRNLLEHAEDRPVALSLEMFERDVQDVVDEYAAGLISESHFKKSGRAWSNYDTDYKPMVDRAIEAGIPIIAANAPRRYVNRATREGASSLEALSPRARSWLAPLPYEAASEEYAAQWNALMAEQMAEMQAASKDEKSEVEQKDTVECGCGRGKRMRHGKCPHCRHGMGGDSTGAGMHMQMGAMHGKKMMMHSDSTGMSGGMCPHCRHGMGADSTAAGMQLRIGADHGKKISDEEAALRAMPDDEIHRRYRPESEQKAEKSESGMSDAGAMHSMMSGMLDAQALWDATMAHSIAGYLEREPGALVMHAAGGFHVEYGTGIPEQLPVYFPRATQLIVSIRSADDVATFDDKDVGRGDFVILTDAALPRSYESRTD
jgi:uncharacterized iron-regulated protein